MQDGADAAALCSNSISFISYIVIWHSQDNLAHIHQSFKQKTFLRERSSSYWLIHHQKVVPIHIRIGHMAFTRGHYTSRDTTTRALQFCLLCTPPLTQWNTGTHFDRFTVLSSWCHLWVSPGTTYSKNALSFQVTLTCIMFRSYSWG